MTMSSTSDGFETLRGTMLTEAGWEGLHQFSRADDPREMPTHLVIDEAYTPECGDIIDRVSRLETIHETSPETAEVERLVRFLGQVSKSGVEEALWTQGTWVNNCLSMQTHVDFKSGHTILGFFKVIGSPHFTVYVGGSDEPQAWPGMNPQITHTIPVSIDQPEVTEMKSRQMIILNGAAVPARQDVNGQSSLGWASLPHTASVNRTIEPLDKRSRLMVYAAPFKFEKDFLPGSD